MNFSEKKKCKLEEQIIFVCTSVVKDSVSQRAESELRDIIFYSTSAWKFLVHGWFEKPQYLLQSIFVSLSSRFKHLNTKYTCKFH